MRINVKAIVRNAIIMAIYIVLTFITYPISFNGFQFRISEMLILLCFFRRDYILGLTLGCMVANISSPIPFDWAIGAAWTLLSGLLLSFCKHLFVGVLFTIAINAFGVGMELFLFCNANFWASVGLVAVGEVTVLTVAYIACMILKKRKNFYKVIDANRNLDFKF